MRRLVALLLPAVITPLVAVTTASPAQASTKHPYCDSNSVYGTSCIDLQGTGLQLTDVIGYFVPPNRDYFSARPGRSS